VIAFILRRLLQSLLVMVVVAFIAFGLFNFTGDPVQFMVGQDTTLEERAKLRADLGLDQSFYVQFARYVSNAVRGEFGLSLRQARKVSVLLKERLRRALAKIPAEDAELFVLCYLEGNSYDELAAQFKLERGTVASRLHRIRAVLQKHLTK